MSFIHHDPGDSRRPNPRSRFSANRIACAKNRERARLNLSLFTQHCWSPSVSLLRTSTPPRLRSRSRRRRVRPQIAYRDYVAPRPKISRPLLTTLGAAVRRDASPPAQLQERTPPPAIAKNIRWLTPHHQHAKSHIVNGAREIIDALVPELNAGPPPRRKLHRSVAAAGRRRLRWRRNSQTRHQHLGYTKPQRTPPCSS